MALALYRKYRPKTFAELIGQEHVTEPLSQALRTGRLHHAYLFSGPRGCGKTSSARILARSLNCEKGPTPEPCDECESCRALGNDGPGSIDVIEIDAASHGGVDDARDLRERAFFTPVASRFKIYIIDEAHMVSSAGFNALLKLVEEPPDFVKFIFATTEPEKVLPTIKSRTHHYPFRLYPPSVVRPYLERLCAAEGVTVEPAVFPLVVRAGGGSMRDSLSVLDQLIAGAGPDGVGYARAVALLGVTDAALLDELCDALAAGDGSATFQIVDRVVDAGHDPRRFASDLLERLRDLIVMQQVPDAASKGLLDAPADQLDRMAVQASQLGPATLTRCAEIVHNGLIEMRGTASPRLLLELICARMLLPGADDSGEALLHRLERMERRLGAAEGGAAGGGAAEGGAAGGGAEAGGAAGSGPPLPAESPAAQPSATESPATESPAARPPAAQPRGGEPAEPPQSRTSSGPPPAAAKAEPAAAGSDAARAAVATAPGTLDAAAIRRVWDEIVTTVGRRSKRAAAVVREATVRDVDGGTIVLLFQHTVHATMLAGSPQPLLDALHDVLGGGWQIRCEARDAPSTSAPQRGGRAATAPAQPAGGAAAGGAAAGGAAAGGAAWPEPARPGGARAEPEPARADEPVAEPVDEFDEVDEVGDARTAAATSEQQALDLLQQSLGAEKIGEVAP